MKTVRIFKIGGNVVDHPDRLEKFLRDFAAFDGLKVLVHGGGKIATTLAAALGVETKMIDGRRVTDAETLRIVTMVYAGGINKPVVARLNALGCPAWGLCGADGAILPARKRAAAPVDYGYVGDPDPAAFDADAFALLLENGYAPVFAPITLDEEGGLLNTNADTVAGTIAQGLAGRYRVHLVYCFEKNGVLRDTGDENSVIPLIDPAAYARLKAGRVISDGMLPKIDNAFKSVQGGVASVIICNSDRIADPGQYGTTIQL